MLLLQCQHFEVLACQSQDLTSSLRVDDGWQSYGWHSRPEKLLKLLDIVVILNIYTVISVQLKPWRPVNLECLLKCTVVILSLKSSSPQTSFRFSGMLFKLLIVGESFIKYDADCCLQCCLSQIGYDANSRASDRSTFLKKFFFQNSSLNYINGFILLFLNYLLIRFSILPRTNEFNIALTKAGRKPGGKR